jgi:alpha-tubulin suppressor-like RCC1 family protein
MSANPPGKPKSSVMALDWPSLPGSNTPVYAPDADICLSIDQYESDVRGQRIIIDPWLHMNEHDTCRLTLNGVLVGTKTIEASDEHKQVEMWIPPLRLQGNRINQIFYSVTRISQNVGISTPILRVMYNNIRPGDKADEPVEEGHSKLLLKLPQDVLENGIDIERAEQGVLVCVSYPYCRTSDMIWLDCNGKDHTHQVSEAEAELGQVCFDLFNDIFELAGDNANFIFKYTVVDQCQNSPDPRAPYSVPVSVVVDLKGNRLDAPTVKDADPVTKIIDLSVLGGRDVTVEVETPGPGFEVNDRVSLTWHGLSEEDTSVIEGPIELPVTQVGVALKFFIPNAKVKAIVNGRASVAYLRKRSGVVDRPSKVSWVDIEDKASRLLQVVGSRSQTGPHYHANLSVLSAALSANGTVLWTYAGESSGQSGRFFLDTEPERALIVVLQNQGAELDRMVLRPSNITGVFSQDSRRSGCITKDDGSLFGWSDQSQMLPPPGLSGVSYTAAGGLAYAVIKNDATVQAWGSPEYGGVIPANIQTQLTNVKKLFSNGGAFVALRSDGSVVAWGSSDFGGSIPPAIAPLLHQVTQVIGATNDFSALLNDGRVFSWGETWPDGLQVSAAQGAMRLCASNRAFAALKVNRTVVAWGSSEHGGSIPDELSGQLVNVTLIVSSSAAFAVLRADGSVFAWGNSRFGGNAPAFLQNVQHVAGSTTAFCALKHDGSLTAWGEPGEGGTVPAGLDHVVSLSASYGSFCAVTDNRTATSWGSNAGTFSLSPAVCVYCAGPYWVLLSTHRGLEAKGAGAPDLGFLNGEVSYIE